jgi:GT2 family glycosyltransferase
MNKFSINLVTWNGERYIEDCLYSILNQTFKDFSLIIIDNGSTDRTLELINERFPHLSVIKHRENLGFTKAHNQAIHWSKSEYVLCLNQDVVLEPDFLLKMDQFLQRNSLAGAVTPKVLRTQEREKTKYIDTLGLKLLKNFSAVEIGAGEQDNGQFDVSKEVFGVSGAVPIYSRKALEEIRYKNEYFDEDFFSYKEDLDLSARLRYAGWQCWYNPSSIAYHDRSVGAQRERMSKWSVFKSRRKKSKFANFYSYRNHLYFLYKNIPNYKIKNFWPILTYETVKFFYVLVFETRNIRAWRAFFKMKKVMRQKRDLMLKGRKISDEEFYKWRDNERL